MRFKVRTRGSPREWWTKDDCRNTDHECEAYIFDSDSLSDMDNFLADHDKREDVLKVMGSVKLVIL